MIGHDGISPPEAYWRSALADGRFLLQRSVVTGAVIFPPRLALPGEGPLEWFEACGKGTVYAVTVVHRLSPEGNYNVVLVDLAEGPRMMSRVEEADASAVTIGLAVQAQIVETAEGPVVVFHPA